MRRLVSTAPLAVVLLLVGTGARAPAPRVATLSIPGPPAFAPLARDVLDAAFSLDPSLAANAGLFDDATRVPSYSPSRESPRSPRGSTETSRPRGAPQAYLDVNAQLNLRWVYAAAKTLRPAALEERIFEHRPARIASSPSPTI